MTNEYIIEIIELNSVSCNKYIYLKILFFFKKKKKWETALEHLERPRGTTNRWAQLMNRSWQMLWNDIFSQIWHHLPWRSSTSPQQRLNGADEVRRAGGRNGTQPGHAEDDPAQRMRDEVDDDDDDTQGNNWRGVKVLSSLNCWWLMEDCRQDVTDDATCEQFATEEEPGWGWSSSGELSTAHAQFSRLLRSTCWHHNHPREQELRAAEAVGAPVPSDSSGFQGLWGLFLTVLRVHTLDVRDNLFFFPPPLSLLHRDEMRTRTEGDKEASDWI